MENQKALEAIRKHYATLAIGQHSKQMHIYTQEEVVSYAERFDVAYPGSYIAPNGDLLVPPALIFMRPAATFGITDPDAPAQAKYGIYTKARRRYFQPVRVGQKIVYDGRIVDTYVRRGYYYLAVEWQAENEDGALLAKGLEWHTIGFVREET